MTTPTSDAVRPQTPRRRVAIGLLAACLGASTLAAGGCNNAGEGALSGAAIGALGGLAIGSLTGSAGAGAAIGAVSGAAAGAVIGDQNERNDRRSYQQKGSWEDDW